MIFSSISYSNLLPFYIFFKRYIRNNQIKQIALYKKDVPSSINKKFLRKKIDAAFISSIKSKRCKCTNSGIVAYKEVYSVLVIKNNKLKKDKDSNTSNKLAEILNINGEIIIGDKALKYFLNNKNSDFIDLSKQWYKQTKLPFVFARLCSNKHHKLVKKISKKFESTKVKIPYYYLKKEAFKKGITPKELKWYLENIYYKIGYKEEISLKKFFKLSKKIK